MKLKEIIFGLFGLRDNFYDNGFLKEFNELLADDFDSNELSLLENSFVNIVNSKTIQRRFLNLRVQELRVPYLSEDDRMLRTCYRFFDKFQKIKGTIAGFRLLFRLIGIDSEIKITWNRYEGGFDSSNYTLDSIRGFDSYKGNYTGVSIELKCTKKLTVELMNMIYNVIGYNLPLNCYVLVLTYNGAEMGLSEIESGRSYNDSFSASFGSQKPTEYENYLYNTTDIDGKVLITEKEEIINYG